MRLPFASLLCVLIFQTPNSVAEEAGSVALERIEGVVQVQRKGVSNPDLPWEDAAAGRLGTSDRLKTGEGSALLVFSDGSTLVLKSMTTIGISDVETSKIAIELESGEIDARISPHSSRDFTVSSSQARAETTGADFVAEAPAGGAMVVRVSKGRVKFWSRLGAGVVSAPSRPSVETNSVVAEAAEPNTPKKAPSAAEALTPPMATPRGSFWDFLDDLGRPRLRWGIGELHPFYRFDGSYDSNIYLVPDDKPGVVTVGGGKRGSWIASNEAGMTSRWAAAPGHTLDLGGGVKDKTYSEAPSANNSFGYNGDAVYDYKGGYFHGGLSDNYLNTVDPAFSELVAREQRWQNVVAGHFEYAPEGGALFAGLDGAQRVDKYLDPTVASELNRYSQLAGVKLGYQVQPQTRVYSSYHREIIHYTDGRTADSKAHLVDFGIEGVISPLITGHIQTGAQFRQYDFDPANPGLTNYTRNWQVSTQLDYRPLNRTNILLTVSRMLAESSFLPNRFYISNLVALTAEHRLPVNVTVGCNLSYGVDKYPDAATVNGVTRIRRDDLYLAEIHVRYDIQDWLFVGGSYQNRSRFSTFADAFNYRDDITTFSVGLKL